MGGIGMGMGMQDPNHAQQLAMQFQVFDTDGNGYLTANEVLAILMRSSGGNPLSMEDAQEFIAAFDTNGDGLLHYHEFCNAMSQMAPPPPPMMAPPMMQAQRPCRRECAWGVSCVETRPSRVLRSMSSVLSVDDRLQYTMVYTLYLHTRGARSTAHAHAARRARRRTGRAAMIRLPWAGAASRSGGPDVPSGAQHTHGPQAHRDLS
jgi:hypothetical protein